MCGAAVITVSNMNESWPPRRSVNAGALPLFQQADAAYPGAAPKHNIALCLDKLGRTEEAIEHLALPQEHVSLLAHELEDATDLDWLTAATAPLT